MSGATPIAIVWDYLNLAYRDVYPAIKYSVSIPTTGRYGGFYCQAISKSAPHPNAAKLWQQFVYSDEGQLAFLAGYAHPARYAAMAAAGKIPASLSKKLPSASQYSGVKFRDDSADPKSECRRHKELGLDGGRPVVRPATP